MFGYVRPECDVILHSEAVKGVGFKKIAIELYQNSSKIMILKSQRDYLQM